MDKKQLSERDICTKYITPALQRTGWNIQTQIREEFPLTDGKIIVRGKLHSRGRPKRADYVLFYQSNLPLAVLEAKDNNHSVGDGMQQALQYRELLQVPFAFSSNGDRLLFHNTIHTDGVIERELEFEDMPSPETLWRLWLEHQGLNEEQTAIITQDYYSDGSGKDPRYYQILAINKTIEAIAKGQNRILLVMATGTGKTLCLINFGQEHDAKFLDYIPTLIGSNQAVSWGLDETSVVEIVEIEEGLLIRKKSSPPSLDALLATIPPDFTYPDDVADFVRNEPKGNELL